MLPWALGLVFGSGAFFAGVRIGLRQLTRDLNGAMARNREDHREILKEYTNAVLVLMAVLDKREDRELLAWFLRR